MFRSSFSETGLAIGRNDRNMAYIYGLSDFWAYMFSEPEKTNLMAEASTQTASEIYSHFLQMTSSLSLDSIQVQTGVQIKLALIATTDAVAGTVNTYTLPEVIDDARYIADRPLLPQALLEKDVHFSLVNNGTQVQFSQAIANYGFPIRVTSTGVTQYAIWFVDAQIDEEMITKYYGNLIGVSPEASSLNFKNFVYGLFYLYTNGPTVTLMRKGLNIALGIPLSRGVETVLQIRKYLDTNQWMVITDQNSYVIPYGLTPTRVTGVTLAPGDVIQPLDELAQWVEVKDYQENGKWWINLMIPQTILPNLPNGVSDRHAVAGGALDTLMLTWLKNHTFLVNVKNISFENIQFFEQISTLIQKAKPLYTYPIYIWSVPIVEVITITESFSQTWNILECEPVMPTIDRFNRNSSNPVYRGCSTFIRMNVPVLVSDMMGDNPNLNGYTNTVDGGTFTGFINPQNQFRALESTEIAWNQTIMCRSSDNFRKTRGMISFNRGLSYTTAGVPVRAWKQPNDFMRIVPLYATTRQDLANKFAVVPASVPSSWSFTLFQTSTSDGPINSYAINANVTRDLFTLMQSTFSTLFFPTTSSNIWIGNFMPKNGYVSWTPVVTDLVDGDYLLFISIMDQGIGVYWVTSNQTVKAPMYYPVTNADPITLTMNAAPIMRGLGIHGAPYYVLRGAGSVMNFGAGVAVDAMAINASEQAVNTNSITYSDTYNAPTIMTRGGAGLTQVTLNHKRTYAYANQQ